MQVKWKEIWKKYRRQILIMMGCIFAVLIFTLIAVNAQKMDTAFDPDSYADADQNKDNSIEYDSTIFGADQDNNDGLEMDNQAEEDYNLDDGNDQNLLDKQNQNNQNGLQISDGTGTGTANGNAVSATNNGTGTVIAANGGSNAGSNGNGTGSGTSGSGGSGGSGSGEGGQGGGQGGTGSDQDIFGTDYNAPEQVQSSYPDESTDSHNGVSVVNLTVSVPEKAANEYLLKQHFFEGEFPRSEEMSSYIRVDAVMSDGSVRKDLKFIPFAGKGTGGDYSVEWSGTNDSTEDGIGKNAGSYIATISYRGATCSVDYDVVHWQVTLQDFDESQSGDPNPGTLREDLKTVSPDGTPIVNLENSCQEMYNLIEERTQSGYNYQHVNKWQEITTWYGELKRYSMCYFGGWIDESTTDEVQSSKEKYEIKRPKDSDIKDGVYNVNLLPTWTDISDDDSEGEEYIVGLTGDPMWGEPWTTTLLRYKGKNSTLVVPQGVEVFDITTMYSFLQDTMSDGGVLEPEPNTAITKIVLPASVTSFNESLMADWHNYFPSLESIQVASDNQNYASLDGVVYNKTGKTLISVPAAKKSMTTWSDRVDTINANAFQYTNMKKLSIPATVQTCWANSFMNATIDTLIFETEEGLNLQGTVFSRDCDNEGGFGKIEFKTSDLSSLETGNDWFGVRENSERVLKDVSIVVPDSPEHKVYMDYLKLLQGNIDYYNGSLDTGFNMLTTAESADKQFHYTKGLLLSKDQKQLMFGSVNLKEDIQIPDGVEEIKNFAFADCSQVTSIDIPASVTTIGDSAFVNMTQLNSLFMRGDTPATFANTIFGATIASGFRIYVPEKQYDNYINIEGYVLDRDYGDGTADIVYAKLNRMDDIIINNGNMYYENEADGTYQLAKVNEAVVGIFTPMEGTSELLTNCFANCSQLTGVVLPDTVCKLQSELFPSGYDYSNFEVIASNAKRAPIADDNAFANLQISDVHLFIPSDTDADAQYEGTAWDLLEKKSDPRSSYFGENDTKDYHSERNGAIYSENEDSTFVLLYAVVQEEMNFCLKDATSEIADEAFKGKEFLTGVENAYGVTTIGASAFENCSRFVGIELSYSIESLGQAAFKNCTSFCSMMSTYAPWGWTQIPSSIESIPNECFEGCESIVEIYFPTTIRQLGKRSFADCSGIVNIISGKGDFEDYYSTPFYVEDIPEECFAGCTSIENLFLSSANTTIGERAFAGDSSLRFISIPDYGTTVPQFANSWLEGSPVADVEINGMMDFAPLLDGVIDNVEILDFGSGFAGQDINVDDLSYFAEHIKEIDNCTQLGTLSGSFASWNYLKSIISFGSAWNDSEFYAFYATIDVLGDRLFAGCISLKTVDIGDIQSIGNACFFGCSSLESVSLYTQQDFELSISDDCFEGTPDTMSIFINGEPYIKPLNERAVPNSQSVMNEQIDPEVGDESVTAKAPLIQEETPPDATTDEESTEDTTSEEPSASSEIQSEASE